jgi:NADPH2:quinone reductase
VRAWLLNAFDGVESLRLGEVADPVAEPGQVILAVRLAALNPADAFLAQGLYPARPPLPHVLGRDGVGRVMAVHADVKEVRPGDTRAILRGSAGVDTWGTLAEKVAVPVDRLVPVPRGWSLEETAGAPLVFLTAWQALTQWSDPPAPPPAGSIVLVTGASGGVGVATLLLARSMDLRIIALSRHAEKARRLKALGAEIVLDPSDPGLRSNVLDAIAPRRVDLVVDMVAGPLLSLLVTLLTHHGRISVVGRSAGDVPNFNTATLFFRRARIGGVAASDYSASDAQAAWQDIVRRLDAIGERPVVDRVFAFEEAKNAFARLREGPMGKVLVRIE